MTSVFDDHLTLDAIVAFADGEMALTPYQRAAAHLMRCSGCAMDVAEQTGAAAYLRQAALPRMPGSLLNTLNSIPVTFPQADLLPGTVRPAECDPRLGPGRLIDAQDLSALGQPRR